MSDHMFQIPEPWEISKLPEIADINMGQSPSSSDVNEHGEGIVFFQGKAEFGKLYPTPKKYCTKPTKIASAGDILLSVRAPVGPTNLANQSTAIGRGLAAISAYHGLMESRYLLYFFKCIEPWLSTQGTGSTFKAISGQFIRDLQSPVPPLAEQKIIAEKLDTLLAQVDSTKARLEQIPQILKRFRQAVLAAVVNGKLSKNTKQWEIYLLKNICTSISDGDHQAPPKSETGIPFLVISDVNKGVIDFDNVSRWVPESYYQSLKEIRKPCQYDILYTVTGSYGIPVIVNNNKPFCFQRHIAIIKPNRNLIDHRFLAFYLESPQIFKHASDVATGTAQKTVSLSSLRNFEISVPPLKEQHEIVRRVEQLFAYADAIEKQVNNALARVNNLTQSILAKAFRGELTAQWRAENPELISGENSAAALLEKIKAERAASGGKKASRKKP
ncbi:restriction endonuclease subunit S [Escherichia coli]|uniref:Restriction endonuclease subunit S n=2 Tax=Escherichia coli TaxID=562 RepID=A0A6D0DGL9_ECOLX|nr:restriction endonuclease subunit S [Escherichia coli]EFA2318989.1 restriction endonuclease subunit S [Escherichia coli]EJV4896163.1 restriction endonuclease subunit S [Escherichia coli]MBA8195757.1 restriction endonuclease subunit S [Escherichia coli]MCQ1705455.1 restriction endonuclease subunit S [Escherichia coli]MEB6351528.1 restriction endonuclease subunit S [Escherichia coli]